MRSYKILVADDSNVEAERIRQVLKSLPSAEVTVVEDGAQAVRESKHVRFDLVLCDYEMPGLNGLQVVRVLRSTWSRLELPILMLTVRDDVQTKAISLRQGANDYVTKPVEPEELVARVQGQLDMRALMEENVMARMQMLQARKLETIGRLAAGVAHELNTPAQFTADNVVFLQKVFAGTRDVLSLVRDHISSLSPAEHPWVDDVLETWQRRRIEYLLAEAPKALDESINGVMRMARVVRDLREFAGAPDQSWDAADLNRALENTVAVSRPLWSTYATVSMDLDLGLQPVVCDVSALKQAFFNAMISAVELAKGSEQPRSAIAVHVRTARAPGGVAIELRAEGAGVPRELPHAIESALAGRALPHETAAQGLAVAHYVIVIQHRGELSCQTTPAEYVSFRLVVPETPAIARARSDVSRPPA